MGRLHNLYTNALLYTIRYHWACNFHSEVYNSVKNIQCHIHIYICMTVHTIYELAKP